jgi:uncharacterized membrane protein
MPTVEENIEVNAPVEKIYRAWTNYEKFPQFMSNVKEVRRTGPDMTHWVVEAAGKTVEWEARTVTEDRRRVAWTAQGESGQSGEVRFTPLGANKTRIDVKMDWNLDSKMQESAAKALGIDERIVHRDLENFKQMVENSRYDPSSLGMSGGMGY